MFKDRKQETDGKEIGKPHPDWRVNYEVFHTRMRESTFRKYIGGCKIVEYFMINEKCTPLVIWDPETKIGTDKAKRKEFLMQYPDWIGHYVLFVWIDPKTKNLNCCDLIYHKPSDHFMDHFERYILRGYKQWNQGRQYDPKYDYFNPSSL